MPKVLKSCILFFRRETVLCISALLALVSAFLVPPGPVYLSYIDWDTLALLFSLMAVMAGLQQAGVFVFLGNQLLRRTGTTRSMLLVLVFLPFICSMVITNDVSLITFVPFGIIVLQMAKQEQLLVPLVVMQTVAANLGSMLTPMGNPQNLYLYAKSGMSFGAFCGLMLPYVLLSGLCLFLLILFRKSAALPVVSVKTELGGARELLCCAAGFALCLLGLFRLVPPLLIAALVFLFLLVAGRSLLAKIDYSLLGTFFFFFIFIGNIGNIDAFASFLSSVISGRVAASAILTSQIISNVPAALLLSGFTSQWDALIIGCNLGGLGTLIASMASLISYKMVARDDPRQRKKYILQFTWYNICLLGVLFLLCLFLQ